MIKYLFIVFLTFFVLSVYSQNDSIVFNLPVKFPIKYAGNFGEIRPNHFHTGVDIKTQGKKGKGLYSIADGYISRMKIDLWGYGRTVYINHPNGYTSVYAHLSKFSKKLELAIKEAQYEQQTYTIDVYFKKNQITVSSGELIGLSGNSGNSFGPHLHFEIRDIKTEYALNPFMYGYKVTDNIAPEIYKLAVYPIDSFSTVNNKRTKLISKAIKISGTYNIKDTIDVSGNIGFGVATYDFINGVSNKFAPYKIELFVDSVLYTKIIFDKFDFYDKRYINSYIDYKEYYKSKTKIHRLFLEPNNKVKIYRKAKNNGILNFYEEGLHNIKIVITDINGNKSVLKSIVRASKFNQKTNIVPKDNYMAYFKNNKYSTYDILITIPRNALYNSINFEYSIRPKIYGTVSKIHLIHEQTTPLHKKYEIAINTDSILKKYLDKTVIVKVSDKNRLSSYGGELRENYIFINVYKFGGYALAIDTVAPSIRPLNLVKYSKGTKLVKTKKIKFRITDNLSGIEKINGYIDDSWVCFEYEPKSASITYNFDEHIDLSIKTHKIKLIIEDERKNITQYETKFIVGN